MLFNEIKKIGEENLLITKDILYCNVNDDILDERDLDGEYFRADQYGNIFIIAGNKVSAKVDGFLSDEWLDLKFSDGEHIDVSFANISDYDNHFEILK